MGKLIDEYNSLLSAIDCKLKDLYKNAEIVLRAWIEEEYDIKFDYFRINFDPKELSENYIELYNKDDKSSIYEEVGILKILNWNIYENPHIFVDKIRTYNYEDIEYIPRKNCDPMFSR